MRNLSAALMAMLLAVPCSAQGPAVAGTYTITGGEVCKNFSTPGTPIQSGQATASDKSIVGKIDNDTEYEVTDVTFFIKGGTPRGCKVPRIGWVHVGAGGSSGTGDGPFNGQTSVNLQAPIPAAPVDFYVNLEWEGIPEDEQCESWKLCMTLSTSTDGESSAQGSSTGSSTHVDVWEPANFSTTSGQYTRSHGAIGNPGVGILVRNANPLGTSTGPIVGVSGSVSFPLGSSVSLASVELVNSQTRQTISGPQVTITGSQFVVRQGPSLVPGDTVLLFIRFSGRVPSNDLTTISLEPIH